MPLPAFLQRFARPASAADSEPRRRGGPAAGDDPAPVHEARVRARRRLIGAVVLLAIGVVGFPLLFETQPRPVGVDVAIQVDGAPPVAATARPAARGTVAPAPAPKPDDRPPTVAAEVPAPVESDAGETTAAGPDAATPAAAPASATRPATAPAQPLPPARPAEASLRTVDGAPAAASASRSARFVVQVGAYTDPGALRDARAKVDKLGLKSYTQVVETEAGRRTRVRVGPFDGRDAADAAAKRLKAAGLPASILQI